MKKAYILIHNDVFGSREEIKSALEKSPVINNWRYDMPHSFYLLSEYSAKEISQYLTEKLGNEGRHIVTEVDTNYWGRTHKETWAFIKKKGNKADIT